MQIKLFKEIQKNGYSVRKVEEMVQQLKNGEDIESSKKENHVQGSTPRRVCDAEETTFLLFKYKGADGLFTKGKGKISIPFANEEELEHIMNIFDKLKSNNDVSIFKNNILCKFTIISSILVIISLDAQAQAKNKAKTDFVSDTVGIDNKEVIAADKVLTHKDSLQLISSDSIGKKKKNQNATGPHGVPIETALWLAIGYRVPVRFITANIGNCLSYTEVSWDIALCHALERHDVSRLFTGVYGYHGQRPTDAEL